MNDKVITGVFFILGEKKYVNSKIYPRDESETVVVTNATYKLTRLSDGMVEKTGNLTVEGAEMKVLIEPEFLGKYLLTETVTVGAEVFRKNITVTVTKG